VFNQKKEETMKKIYKNPEMEIVKTKAMQLLAGSDPKLSEDYNPATDPVLGREDGYEW